MACDPQVLILDEAVSALDVSVQGQVLNRLVDSRARLGVAHLSVAHDLGVVQQVTDRPVVMHLGASSSLARPKRSCARPQHGLGG